jgi:hypothetical protein
MFPMFAVTRLVLPARAARKVAKVAVTRAGVRVGARGNGSPSTSSTLLDLIGTEAREGKQGTHSGAASTMRPL